MNLHTLIMNNYTKIVNIHIQNCEHSHVHDKSIYVKSLLICDHCISRPLKFIVSKVCFHPRIFHALTDSRSLSSMRRSHDCSDAILHFNCMAGFILIKHWSALLVSGFCLTFALMKSKGHKSLWQGGVRQAESMMSSSSRV